MVLLTGTLADVARLDRLAVPGRGGPADLDPGLAAWSARERIPVDAVHASAPGFDGALEYLAGTSVAGSRCPQRR
jgi:hypothetical protein